MQGVAVEQLKTPGELYAGASFTAVTEMAQAIGHDNIFIVTGGIGLGRHTDKIPPYDFTSDKKADHNAHQHVTGEKFLPHVWWSKVNEMMRGTSHPVKDLLDQYDFVVGALPKAFIKYLIADLELCGVEDREKRIFIPVPYSMLGSFPKTIQNAFVPYTANYTANIVYGRTDKAQRVVQKFLRDVGNADSSNPFEDVALGISDEAMHTGPTNVEDVDYDAIFKQYPEILEAPDVGTAIHKAKAIGIRLGGKLRFAGAWRSAKGPFGLEASAKEQKAAHAALKQIMADGMEFTATDDELILERIGLFVSTLRASNPKAAFTSREVTKWAEIMYPNDLRGLDNTNKVTYMIMYNAQYLGVTITTSGSRKIFKVL